MYKLSPGTHDAHESARHERDEQDKPERPHKLSLMVLAGNAFTTFFAGFAFTITTLPKISLLPAFVAGFVLVLRRSTPGRAKTPVFFTSAVAIAARLSSTFEHWVFFSSQAVASCSAMALFPMAFFATAFMPFIGAIVIREGDSEAKMICEIAVWPHLGQD